MTRWDVILGGGTLAVLAALTVSTVRSVREVLAVEKERRRRLPLVVVGEVERRTTRRPCQDSSLPDVARGAGGFLPAVGPSPVQSSCCVAGCDCDPTAYLDDEIAATARRIIRDQGLIP